ncbi:MAG: hypothetical protein HFH49_13100 [Lachnospiraceae bacterium]|nr:hypothetical protein [Lachnospiraceae bacterium]
MGERKEIYASDGNIIEVELVIPDDYKYDDEERNEFMQGFVTGTAFDRQIEMCIKKGWVEEIRKTGEWK